MALTPGSRISKGDLDALAIKANGKSSLSKKVNPCYNDGAGQPYGHKRFTDVKVDPAHAGTGYILGNILSLGFGSQFAVVDISATGAVRGLRIVNAGVGQYNDPTWNGTSGTQITNSGGTGSGCQLLYSFTQNGPTVDFTFGDFSLTAGKVTGYYLVAGGAGYAAGDTLGFAEQSGALLTVVTVDGAGAILTFNLATPCGLTVVPQTVKNMSATGGAGTGAKFGGYFTLGANPKWMTELNRLRTQLDAAAGASSGGQDVAISGPWPIATPSPNYRDQAFYFPDTGSAVNITISTGLPSYFSMKGTYEMSLKNRHAVGWNSSLGVEVITDSISQVDYTDSRNYIKGQATLVIGGSQPVHVKGVFWFEGNQHGGLIFSESNGVVTTNSQIPISDGIVQSGNLPGAAGIHYFPIVQTDLGFGLVEFRAFYAYWVLDDDLSPGTYHFILSAASFPNDVESVYYNPSVGSSYSYTHYPRDSIYSARCNNYIQSNFIPAGTAVASSVVNSGAAQVAGIHGTKNIFRLPLYADAVGNNALAGQIFYTQRPTGYTPFPAVDGHINSAYFYTSYVQMFGWTLSTLPDGLWAGMIPMVNDIRAVTPAKMPWNYTRTKYVAGATAVVNPALLGDLATTAAESNSYDQTKPVEYQVELPGWVASRRFTLGFCIIDANGNFQRVKTAGTSGSTAPTWPRWEGHTVSDGSVTWECYRVLVADPATLWSAGSWPVGYAITDANGNTQVVTTAGTTPSWAPAWATVTGAKTSDGSVIWEMRSRFVPVQHRPACVPCYPIYWASETIARLKPPTSTSGLTIWGAHNQWQRNVYHSPDFDVGWQQDNKAKGWWIYSVALNRAKFVVKAAAAAPSGIPLSAGSMEVGAGDMSVGAAGLVSGGSGTDTGEISVTIGCMRNSAFVAFGTFLTGQTARVLWPIFTSDALVYQASERVDIQAVAIAATGAGVSMGSTAAGFPVNAAFISDPITLLDLVT